MLNRYQIDTFKYDLGGVSYYCEVWNIETGKVEYKTNPGLATDVRKKAVEWVNSQK